MGNITISAPTTGNTSVTISVPTFTTSLSDYLNDGDNRGLAISIPYTGSGINLTSMGRYETGPTNTVWRLRNGTNDGVSSSLVSYNNGSSTGYYLPEKTDTFVASDVGGTHILNYDGGRKTKAAGTQTFSYNYDISPLNSGNASYTLLGGNGDDDITGTFRTTILAGNGGNDTLTLLNNGFADTVSYHFGDGQDTIIGFRRTGIAQDLVSFTGSNGSNPFEIDVKTAGSNTQFRLRDTNLGFGNGTLLATFSNVTGFDATDLGAGGDNLAVTNTATFFFS